MYKSCPRIGNNWIELRIYPKIFYDSKKYFRRQSIATLASESSTTCAVVVVTRSRRRGEELARVTILPMAGGWLTPEQEQEWLRDMQSRSCDRTTLDTRLISCGHHRIGLGSGLLPCYRATRVCLQIRSRYGGGAGGGYVVGRYLISTI